MMPGVFVIGAGPAGCACAIELCRRGIEVTLVDRARFPRAKVCGCCLGPQALAELEHLGFEVEREPEAAPLRRLIVHAGALEAEVSLRHSTVLSRAVLDLRLLELAQAAGARVLTGTRAHLGREFAGGREMILEGDHAMVVGAALVILATGLPAMRSTPSADAATARLGLAQARAHRGEAVAPGAVRMVSADGGYVGLVRFADGTLNVAASLAAPAVEEVGAPGALVDRILEQGGLPPLGWREGWRGTPPLRHVQRKQPGRYLLAVGDAAGFWEPFTGEGIGWALRGGRAVADIGVSLNTAWDDVAAWRWHRLQRRALRRWQWRSRLVARILARPRALDAAAAALRCAPAISARLLVGRQAARVVV